MYAIRSYYGIEDLRLKGRRVEGGYIVSGSLPWVSNLGDDHVFGTLFALEGEPNRSVMALVDCASQGFSLRLSAHFTALEGTRTFACIVITSYSIHYTKLYDCWTFEARSQAPWRW